MQMEPDLVTSDADLLHAYARRGLQASFAELVRRHVDWVYSSARRQVADPGLAEDVTQSVFILLAQKAATFGDAPMLTVWLFRATRLIAADARKMRSRRLKHERIAAEQRSERMDDTAIPTDDANEWARIAPILDDAIARLGTIDRRAVLLRFFRRKSHADVAAALGVSEAAAKMRVSRAVERLRGLLARRGVKTASAATLATCLSGSAVQPAPAALAASSATACTVGTATASASGAASASPATASLVSGAITAMAWHKAKLVAAVVIAALATSGAAATLLLKDADEPKLAAAVVVSPVADNQRWRPAFERAYALPDGRALRRIAPPFVAERQEYIRYSFSGSNMTWVDVNKSPRMMVYDFGREGRPAVSWRNMYHDAASLEETVCAVLGVPQTEVVGPAKLLATPIESDWVCRANATVAERAADLERILRDECGLKVKIRKKRLPQEVIVATGVVTLAPGTAVQVYSDRMSGDRPSPDSLTSSVEEFLANLSVYVGRPVLNESATPPKQKLQWAMHTSGMVGEMAPKRAKVKADMILANVARQSGLQLRRESRPMDVWEVALDESPQEGAK
jgi:RNA polymerase sigma factor (sigma-70 family)